MPFRERVPKQRLTKVSFAGFFHRVAWSAAPWAPILFRAKGHIGITRSYSPRPVAYLDLQSRFAGFTQQRCLRQRHGADRAPARAARNGCAASKTRLTTCEAQTAMASSHRAASWIEGQRSPTDVTWALFQHGRSVEPTRYCLAPVLEGLFRRVYPCLSCRRGIRAPSCTRCAITLAWHIPVIVVRFGRHGAFYLWQVWWSAQAGRKGRHELCSSQPYKPPTNHPARPLMQNFFRCAGQIATPCGARYPSWGEARRKRRQVRTKST